MSSDTLREEVIRLAPWHMEVEITPELSTGVFREADLTAEQSRFTFGFVNAAAWWKDRMLSIYPDGLAGRTVLDGGCNCGGYSFWMTEIGGGGGLGFDVRQLWIDQARFLQANRTFPSENLRFEVAELDDLSSVTDEQFDISLFHGLFYHLPSPIHGLAIAAARTRELISINTAGRNDLPDGMLVAKQEAVAHPLAGAQPLGWYPTGPKVIVAILASLGFTATRYTVRDTKYPHRPNLSSIEVLAARSESTFAHYDRVHGETPSATAGA